MKKAKDGATKRLRIASCLCLFFMILEFVGKSPHSNISDPPYLTTVTTISWLS